MVSRSSPLPPRYLTPRLGSGCVKVLGGIGPTTLGKPSSVTPDLLIVVEGEGRSGLILVNTNP